MSPNVFYIKSYQSPIEIMGVNVRNDHLLREIEDLISSKEIISCCLILQMLSYF